MAAPKKAQDLNDRMLNCEKWVKALSGLSFNEGNFHTNLESGVALCIALNKLKPGLVADKYAKIQAKKLNPFQKRERITQFINGCKTFGVNHSDLFMPDDLFNQSNLKQVVITLENLSSTASKKNVEQPFVIGMSYAKSNKREFTKEQILKAKNAIPAMNKGSVHVDKGKGVDNWGVILQPGPQNQPKQ
eukprot:CAMPEP_0202693730 /NCGR_PEP_ID=MMETSP1385-20130828/7769_1 /ASSEMBLY_ACC=CAM_ASM_000861 /TAXON_ID=933848 /ORGANISM="Elphidium margaritaceum" /LENGTH=188 /DNA_ID=CAMNT_0049349451 /DNA_START=28 /DNA_END=594 /DNA_ORIENTATION=-